MMNYLTVMIRLTNLTGYLGLFLLWRDWTFYILKTNTSCLLYAHTVFGIPGSMYLWDNNQESVSEFISKLYFILLLNNCEDMENEMQVHSQIKWLVSALS